MVTNHSTAMLYYLHASQIKLMTKPIKVYSIISCNLDKKFTIQLLKHYKIEFLATKLNKSNISIKSLFIHIYVRKINA